MAEGWWLIESPGTGIKPSEMVDRAGFIAQPLPMFNFERLDCWQHAIDFADFVYDATGSFPNDERFGLTNQMRRAAISISANLAEGSSRSSKTDFARFIENAAGSLFEVVSQAFIAKRRGLLSEEQFTHLYAAAEREGRMLSGLRNAMLHD